MFSAGDFSFFKNLFLVTKLQLLQLKLFTAEGIAET